MYRWIVAMFFSICVGYSIYINIQRGYFHVYLIYLTHLNLCATMATTCLGACLVSLQHLDMANVGKARTTAIKFYLSLWNQSIVISLVVSISYWGFHYNDQEIFDLNNVFIHLTNSTVLIVDLLVVRHPVNYFNFQAPIIVELIYTLFTVVYQQVGGLDK